MPLPYLLTCLLLASIAQSPGLFMANLVDTASVQGAVQATFPGLSTGSLTMTVAGAAIGIAFYTGLLYLIRYARRQLASARDSLAPLLQDGEAGFRRIYGIVHAPLPILGIAAILGGFFWAIGSHTPGATAVRLVYVAVQMTIICLSTATVLWTYIVVLWGLRRMGKEPLRLKPYTEDPMLGLRPLGAMSVSASMVYFAMLAVVLLVTLVYPQSPAYLAFLLGMLSLGVLLLVLPLLGIHETMLREKRRVEQALAQEAAREWTEMEAAPPSSEAGLAELRGLVISLRRFVVHERAERKVASLPTWPFDPAVTGRIAAITLTGVVAVLGRAAVDWFLAKP